METAASAPSARTLTILGCDGSYPGPGGAASGYLVEAAGVAIWLDAGPGTFANLQLVMDPARIDAVILSHEHPDHRSDIDSLAVWLNEPAAAPPVDVYAPPGLRAVSYFGASPFFSWHVVEPSDRIRLAPRGDAGQGVLCSFSATDHEPPTLAVRIDQAEGSGSPSTRSLAYSADTGPDWSVEELGPDVGLLLCEATFTRHHEGKMRHLSGRQAGTMAAAAGVGRLVVTHRWPSINEEALAAEVDEAFGRAAHRAAPGRVFEW